MKLQSLILASGSIRAALRLSNCLVVALSHPFELGLGLHEGQVLLVLQLLLELLLGLRVGRVDELHLGGGGELLLGGSLGSLGGLGSLGLGLLGLSDLLLGGLHDSLGFLLGCLLTHRGGIAQATGPELIARSVGIDDDSGACSL